MPLQCRRKRAFVAPFSQSKGSSVKGQGPSWTCPSATKSEAEKNQLACSPVHIGRHVQIITPKTRYKIKQSAGTLSCNDTSPGLVVPFELSQASCLSESADSQEMNLDTSTLDKTGGEGHEFVENTAEQYEEFDLELDQEKLIRKTNVEPANARKDAHIKLPRTFDIYSDGRNESRTDKSKSEDANLFIDDQGTGKLSAATKLPLSETAEVINTRMRREQDYFNQNINTTTENYIGNDKDTSSNFIRGPAHVNKAIRDRSVNITSPKECSIESEYAKSRNVCINKGPVLTKTKPEGTELKTDNSVSCDKFNTPERANDIIKGYTKVVRGNQVNGHKKKRAVTNIQKKPRSKFMSILAKGHQPKSKDCGRETLMKTGKLLKNVKERSKVLDYSPLTVQPLNVTNRTKRQKKLTFEQLKQEVLKTTFRMHKEIIELQERRNRLKAGLFESKGDKCKTKICINRRKQEE